MHTTPALYAVRKAYPEAHVSILVGSWGAPLLRGNPDADEVIICNLPWLDRGFNPSWRPLVPVIGKIRARRFDCVVNFRIAAKAAAFARCLGGRERWGFDVQKSRWAWTHCVPYDLDRHVVDNYMALVGALGVADTSVQFRIFPEVEDLSPVAAFLENEPPAVVLGVTSGRADKAWLPDRWAAVGDHIAGLGFRVLINGGPSEGTEVEAVLSLMQKPAESLVGKFSLLQFAGLLKQCRAIVTLDSFPMHLAAAVDMPIVALFGANSSRQWEPYPGQQVRVVVEAPPEIPRSADAMKWIQVGYVVEAFEKLALEG